MALLGKRWLQVPFHHGSISLSTNAAITKCYSLDDLNNRNFFSQFQVLEA
jgi:hypothetical protein